MISVEKSFHVLWFFDANPIVAINAIFLAVTVTFVRPTFGA